MLFTVNRYFLQFNESLSSYLLWPKNKDKSGVNFVHSNVLYRDERPSSVVFDKELYPPGFSYRMSIPYKHFESNLYPTVRQHTNNTTASNIYRRSTMKSKELRFKLADILSAARFLDMKHPVAVANNLTDCAGRNLTEMAKCCCSKDMQQKCEGVDLSYLLPIPGDTTTNKNALNKTFVGKGCVTPKGCGSTVCQTPKADAHAGRGCRKVEESTLDALRRFQLTHGIFSPNEDEVIKAVEKAKIQLSKVKNKLPDWMKHLKQGDMFNNKRLSESYTEKRNMMKDGSELYKLLPQFKIERVVSEGGNNAMKCAAEANIQNGDVSLIYQNAAAIKKQLETIRQYDILLANIRAQAQLKLVELADVEAKHHLAEERFKKERDQGLEELKNMEEVLKQEIKLARNLPGAETGGGNKWADNMDVKLISANTSVADFTSPNLNAIERPQNAELIQEAVIRNNKLLEELDALLHANDGGGLFKHEHRNVAEDRSLDKLSFLEKALARAIRNNQKVDNGRYKRNCSGGVVVKPTPHNKIFGNYNATDYDKAFKNLQNDLIELKDHLLSQSKRKTPAAALEDNLFVQIKVAVDVVNTTESKHARRRSLANFTTGMS